MKVKILEREKVKGTSKSKKLFQDLSLKKWQLMALVDSDSVEFKLLFESSSIGDKLG